jgi:nucleotide-binding universal stress UspA family protein
MKFHSILVAVDGSRHSGAALAHAIELARDGNARLTILTATPSPPGVSLVGPGAAAVAEAPAGMEHDFHEILRAAVDRVPDDLPVTSVHASGPPATAILSEVKRGDHDLIVMGSRGLGLARALMGSVSHRVLRHAPAAVLIVHAEPGTDAPRLEVRDQAGRGASVSR